MKNSVLIGQIPSVNFMAAKIKPNKMITMTKSRNLNHVRDTPSHYVLSFCEVSLNLLQ